MAFLSSEESVALLSQGDVLTTKVCNDRLEPLGAWINWWCNTVFQLPDKASESAVVKFKSTVGGRIEAMKNQRLSKRPVAVKTDQNAGKEDQAPQGETRDEKKEEEARDSAVSIADLMAESCRADEH